VNATNKAQLTLDGDCMSVSGEIDFHSVVALCAQGERWLQQQAPAKSRVNLAQVTRCNSAATTLLLCWLRAAQSVNKTVAFEAMPEALKSLLDLGSVEAWFVEQPR